MFILRALCIFQLNWLQAPLFASMIFTKLVMYCFLGTLFEVAGDRMYAIVLDTNWYCMNSTEQRIQCVLIALAQRNRLMMAGSLPLNMIICMQAMKTVYSVGMLLIKSTME